MFVESPHTIIYTTPCSWYAWKTSYF